MSVVGFDIGNLNCAIAVAKHGGIDVLLNDESERETPAVVSFVDNQRFFGSAGAAFVSTYPKSSISQIKRLIGKQFKDPSVQEELKLLPFETSEGPRGGILIHLQYLNKKWTFTPVEILGMLFGHLKQVAEKNLGSPVVDCVIGIPSYFTDVQRREYFTAACLSGLRPLKLMHDCTAIALGYGMYKTDFSNKGPTKVVFVDIGHSDTQVTIAAFEKGKMTILSHSFDQNLGGRDFDEVLFRHFASQFKEKYNIDVCSNARASVRLRVSCEKLKKVLSANLEAPLSIECLIDDKDVNGFITREEFEELSLELLDKVIVACNKAGNDAGLLSADEVDCIELVGSGSRVPAIMKSITSVFGKEPIRTLNGSECVARGCALHCAMLSPTFRVPDYKVHDIFPYSFAIRSLDVTNKRHPGILLFQKDGPFPSNIFMRFAGNSKFNCQVFYTNENDFLAGHPPIIGHFTVIPPKSVGSEKVNGLVEVKLNIHGIVEIEPAAEEEIRKRGRGWKNDIAVSENLDVVMTKDELLEALEKEHILTEQDIKMERTKEKRNTLESFIYDNRSKLLSSYRSFATDLEVEEITRSLQEAEDWLYEDGDDESEQAYINTLDYLKKLLDPIEKRYKDELARKEATKALEKCIQENRSAAGLLTSSQKNEVNKECSQVEQWLTYLSKLQDSVPKNATRTYCLSIINGITHVFKRRCKDIMASKPSLTKQDDQKKNLDDTQGDKRHRSNK
ncbi:hypothetical protein LXL04_027084 [Taraxacum kok-saghyz]